VQGTVVFFFDFLGIHNFFPPTAGSNWNQGLRTLALPVCGSEAMADLPLLKSSGRWVNRPTKLGAQEGGSYEFQ
jgi:hypothetical protein